MAEGRSKSAWVRRGAKGIGFLALSVAAGIVGASLTQHFGTSAYTISFADFIAVMLTAITLLMTLLGFILALLAYFGWRDLSDRVDAKVQRQTIDFLEDGFREGNVLHAMLQIRSREAAYQGVDPIDLEEDDTGEDE